METETEVEGEVEVAEARNHGWKQKQRTPEELTRRVEKSV